MTDDYLIADFLDYSEQLMVNNPNQGLIPFKIWDHQSDVACKFLKKRDIVSSASRQMGMTTLMMTLAHWYSSTFPNSVVCYTANNQTMLNVCREFFKQLDYDIKFPVCNVDETRLSNGSRMMFKRPCFETFCGHQFDMLLVDNAAYISGKGGWWSNLKTSVVEDGYIWINSTPTDKTTWFYQCYSAAKRGNRIRLPWNKHPNRDNNWLRDYKLNVFGMKDEDACIKNECLAKFV